MTYRPISNMHQDQQTLMGADPQDGLNDQPDAFRRAWATMSVSDRARVCERAHTEGVEVIAAEVARNATGGFRRETAVDMILEKCF